jgi:hypothetical protein
MIAWAYLAVAMATLALIAGFSAFFKAQHLRKIELAKWKRRAERTHQYYSAMRRIRGMQ